MPTVIEILAMEKTLNGKTYKFKAWCIESDGTRIGVKSEMLQEIDDGISMDSGICAF
jgi:hypothetical protein